MADIINIEVYQGDDFKATLIVRNMDGTLADISSNLAKAQIRDDYAENNSTVIAEISTTVGSPEVGLFLHHNTTKTIPSGRYVWDVQLINNVDGSIQTIACGEAVVIPEVTQ